LQIISHKIKDKVHNHYGSLGLLGLDLALKKILVFLGIQKYLENRKATLKQASNSNESSLSIASLYNNSVQLIT